MRRNKGAKMGRGGHVPDRTPRIERYSSALVCAGLLVGALACSSVEPVARDAQPAADAMVAREDGRVAVDVGPADMGGTLCERLGLYGICDGEVLRFCAFGEVKERDCAAEFTAQGLSGGCGLLSEFWGHDCALAAGEPCVDAAGESAICQGQDSGCFMGVDGRYTCFTEVGSCNPDAPLTKRCDGQRLRATRR